MYLGHIDTESRLPGNSLASVALSGQKSPRPPSKQPRKKPIPLPRGKSHKTPQANNRDLEIYENLGPVKQEEGSAVSLNEYQHLTTKLSSTGGTACDESDEEDATGNTGDSGISEWTGMT